MDNLNIRTAADVRDHLTSALSLDTHTITFHIMEPGPEFGCGLIDAWEDIDMSDAFSIICEKQDDSYNVVVDSVITYQIGNGEAWDATWSELKTIESVYRSAPDAFDQYLAEDAEILCTMTAYETENPAYEAEEE